MCVSSRKYKELFSFATTTQLRWTPPPQHKVSLKGKMAFILPTITRSNDWYRFSNRINRRSDWFFRSSHRKRIIRECSDGMGKPQRMTGVRKPHDWVCFCSIFSCGKHKTWFLKHNVKTSRIMLSLPARHSSGLGKGQGVSAGGLLSTGKTVAHCLKVSLFYIVLRR